MYAFGAALGGQGVLEAARVLAQQSHLPNRKLTLVNRQGTYAHNDLAGAFPKNVFLQHLVPFLQKTGKSPARNRASRQGSRPSRA